MKKLLIVVDMQKDFVDGALGSQEAVAIVDNVVKKIEEFDGDIIVTYDTHPENYMETQEGKNLPVPHCIKGTDGWKLDSKVQAALDKKGFKAIEKPTFGSTALMHHVAALAGQKGFIGGKGMTVELCGVCTDICVVSNALLVKAFFPEAQVRVDSACCAGVTPERHSAALETMASCQIDIL